ncbi:KEOPS complex subunit Pcc1 [Methanobrevibacter sp.]
MKINGKITFTYENENDAKLIYDSLEIDNENFLKSKLDSITIDYCVNNEKLGSFLATVDDLIASEIVAEKIIKETKQ